MRMLNTLKRKITRRTKAQQRTLTNLGKATEELLSRRDFDEVEKRCPELLSFLRALEAEREHPDVLKLLGSGYFDLASVYREMHKAKQAEDFYAAAETFLRELTGSRRHRQFALGQLAACKNHLGLLYMDVGPREKATEAVRMREELAKRFPKDSENRVYLGGALCNRAQVARDSGNIPLARELFEKSIATIDAAIPHCDCDSAEVLAVTISKATGRPHWLLLALHFRSNAEQGLSSLTTSP